MLLNSKELRIVWLLNCLSDGRVGFIEWLRSIQKISVHNNDGGVSVVRVWRTRKKVCIVRLWDGWFQVYMNNGFDISGWLQSKRLEAYRKINMIDGISYWILKEVQRTCKGIKKSGVWTAH